MRLTRIVAGLGFLVLAAAPLRAAAQLRANRPPPQQQNLPRLLVANPHSFSPQDSSASVRVGHGMREEVTGIAERWFRTVTRAQMNEALQQYAYPIDAVLPPMVARQLANALTARAMVISTVVRGEAGRYTVESRLAGTNDDAGQVVRLSQSPNEAFEELGKRIGQALEPAFKALPDARQCENLRLTQPEKAVDAAVKAIRTLPTSGLAHYCEAEIAKAKKSKETAPARQRAWGDTIVTHLKLAVQGDPLSLPAWNGLAVEYQARADSAATVETFKQMLRIAPTNEALRKDAFRLFLNYGRIGSAEQVADEGLQIDPANADLWDLKSSACLFQDTPEKNRCAIEALEQVYALDTTKADTTFFTKITFAASRPSLEVRARVDSAGKVVPGATGGIRDTIVAVVDSARFLKWAIKGHEKYKGNIVLLGQLAEAYSLAGPVDSAVSVMRQLMARDSTDLSPVLRVAKQLSDARRGKDALALAGYAERLGTPENKQTFGQILNHGAFLYLQPPQDHQTAADMTRKALQLFGSGAAQESDPMHRSWQFSHFILGIAAFQLAVAMHEETVKAKSCDGAQKMKTLLDEAGPSLQAGRTISESTLERFIQGHPTYLNQVNQMIRTFCRSR
ncbi:MAG: tetratricopeptide repeat protein [Gemmatimonadales bacterium]